MAWKQSGAPKKGKERKTEGTKEGKKEERKVGNDMTRDSWESDVGNFVI
jgi:hypothetical protein